MTRNIKTITEFHQYRGLPKPEHRLISVIDVETVKHWHADEPIKFNVKSLCRLWHSGNGLTDKLNH